MATFLLGFILLTLVIAAMSIGVLMGRKPITGSCGGVGAALKEKDYECDLCGGNPNKCDVQQSLQQKNQMQNDNDLAFDTTTQQDSQ
ncbi:hypothetical protein AB835_02540 [Candidatus Endobugula sertula]|uniref:ApbE family protein n=1 Tax=Candidatus Endobugula sertula TaxID=62101 RepID=A0A1D2QST1_9GAMM|nr:hypothetical protein AB835_02540 [Candidatus Endobugula sertula]